MAAGEQKKLKLKYREKESEDVINNMKINNMSLTWSGWMLVMGRESENETSLQEKRSGSGYTTSNLSGIEDKCGIYEFAILIPHGSKKYPVYLGSTCRCDNKCSNEKNTDCGLSTRISEYCRGGSNKSELFNQAIDHNMKIYVRTRTVDDKVRGWKKKVLAAREAEKDLLQEYDYAWNIRKNNKQTARSVTGIKPPEIIVHHPCPFCIKILETRPRTA